MALQLNRVEGGFSDGKVHYLSGAAAPGGDASFQDAAPVGSYYSDTDTGDSWKKITAGTGTDKWSNVSISINNISWREPAEVRDNVSATIPVGVGGSTITVDGEVISDQQRVLFTNVAPTERNIWIYDQASGTFSEDGNQESQGDTVYVIRGTNAGHTFSYSALDTWVRTNSTTLDEIGYIQAFIGKVAGTLAIDDPNYSDNNYVTDGDNLLIAIGKLDAALKLVDDQQSAALTAVGLETDGTLDAVTAFGGSNFLTGETTIVGALTALDTALAAADGDTVHTVVNNVTASTVIDTVPLADGAVAEWILYVEEVATPANRRTIKVLAMPDPAGTSVDTTRFAILKNGANISGLSYDVTGDGTSMELAVSSTAAVNVKAARVAVKQVA